MTCKIHLACDRRGNPLGAILSAGHRHDSPQLPLLLNSIRIASGKSWKNRPKQLTADKAYSGKPTRKYLRDRDIKAVIPIKKSPSNTKKTKKGRPLKFDEQTYKERNVIERLINHLKEFRRFATRFEKLAVNFLALVQLAFTRILLKKHFSDTL